jgi:arylformamidase
MLYRGMDRAALDAAYNNTAAVGQAKRDAYVADWTKRSQTIRNAPGARLDVRYGVGPRHRLDVFPSGAPAAPTLIYIHGGYWQMNDKEPYAFLSEGVRGAGFNLALIEYTLAPAARMDHIVTEVRSAVAWVIEHAKEIDGDSARVFVSGHSAGGHLTAMAMTDARVAGGVAISGIYDLEPIRLNYLNEKLGLDVAETERNSPMRHFPATAAPLVVTVGLGELPELVRQSEEYAAAWTARGHRGRYLPVPAHDHFSILEELARPKGVILEALQEMAQIPRPSMPR